MPDIFGCAPAYRNYFCCLWFGAKIIKTKKENCRSFCFYRHSLSERPSFGLCWPQPPCQHGESALLWTVLLFRHQCSFTSRVNLDMLDFIYFIYFYFFCSDSWRIASADWRSSWRRGSRWCGCRRRGSSVCTSSSPSALRNNNHRASRPLTDRSPFVGTILPHYQRLRAEQGTALLLCCISFDVLFALLIFTF